MTGVCRAGLFEAAMSRLDSGINSMTASLVTDWLNGREVGMFANRCLTLAFGAGVTAIACLLSLIDWPVFDILLSIAGATLGLLLAVMLMGMLLPRTNTIGVVVGMLAGLLMFTLIRFVLPQLHPAALEQLGPLAGLKDSTWGDGLFSTVPAVVVGVVVSLFTPPPADDQLRGLLLLKRRAN